MTDTENEKLRKDVERQAQIIDALLDNNKHLKQALAWCQHLLSESGFPIYSNDFSGKPILPTDNAIVKNKNGEHFSKEVNDFSINGVIQTFDDIQNKINGVNSAEVLNTEKIDGVNISQAPYAEKINGVKQVLNTPSSLPPNFYSANSGYHVNHKLVAVYAITPQDIAEGKQPVYYHYLRPLLRKLIPRASDGGLLNTVQILMKLHESPAQSLKSLQKLTHLSEDGITKRIMSMKKFGLIVRASGRRLLLTNKAQQLLEQARYKP